MSVFVWCVIGIIGMAALACWYGQKLRAQPRWWEEGLKEQSFWGDVVDQMWAACWFGVRCACGAVGVMVGATVFLHVWRRLV